MSARRLRITHVVVTDVFAGTERYVVDVARALARRGHELTVVGGEPEVMERLLEPEVRWRPGASAPEAMRSLLHGGRRDIVHSHMAKADFVAAAAGPFTGGARVSTRHITVPRGFSPTARRLAPLVRAGMAREIAVSRWTAAQLDTPVDVVMLNGVEPADDVATDRGPTVLVAQRLAPEKDTATAVRAWARSGLADHGWTMVIAGSGEEREDLERLAASLGVLGSVEFPGWLSDPSMLYRSASMLLAPAPTEPCGLTVIEAMAYGLPVVAAAAGGHLETVAREPTAAMFPPGDDVAAAAHLVRLAGDVAARDAYGRALRERQRRDLTIAGHVDRLEALYAEVAPAGRWSGRVPRTVARRVSRRREPPRRRA